MPGNDDVVLKLIIKGQDPAEIQRLAAETSGRLASESAQHIKRLTDLHKAAAEEQSAAMKKAIDSEIKESQKLLDAIQKIERQREIMANRATASWDRMLERLENITVVARGVFDVIQAGAQRFVNLGNEIDRVTNVYGSLKGSIDEIREASKGEISDIDIISAKNRAFAKDLMLTDEQFGIVAAAADRFADSIGGASTKEKFDNLIDGLATGRLKALASAGVMVDAEKVVAAYAKAHGTVAEALTDEAKKIAVAEAALKAMDKKLIESGKELDNFAHQWESTSALIQNTWDHLLLGLGEFILGAWKGLTIDLPNAVKIGFAKLKDQIPGVDAHFEDQARAAYGKQLEEYDRQQDAIIAKAKARQGNANAYHIASQGPTVDSKKAAAYASKQLGEMYFPDYNRALDSEGNEIPGGHAGQYERDQRLLEIIAQTDQRRVGGADSDEMSATYQRVADRTGHSQSDVTMGFDADKFEAQMTKVQGRIDQLKKENGERGILGMLIFGVDGPDQLYAEMDAFQQAQSDMAVMISNTAQQMAAAVGQSMANWIADTQGAKKSLRDVTNEMLVQLSAQAFTKGLMELAEAAASAATYNFDAAGKHLIAAAAFGAVGAAAGVGARAIGHSSTAAPSSTSRPTSRASGGGYGYGSGSSGSSGRSSGDAPPLTVNLTVFPGGEAEAGRQLNKALAAYYNQTGKGLPAAA